MPTWDKILQEVESLNPLRVLDKYLSNLSRQTKRTSICYMTAFTVVKPPVPSLFHSIIDQDIQGFMTCSKGVDKDGLNLFTPLVVIMRQQKESLPTFMKPINI